MAVSPGRCPPGGCFSPLVGFAEPAGGCRAQLHVLLRRLFLARPVAGGRGGVRKGGLGPPGVRNRFPHPKVTQVPSAPSPRLVPLGGAGGVVPGRRFKDSCVSRGPRGRPRGGRPREGGHVRTCPRPRRSLPARPPGRRGVPPCLPLRRGARKAVARGLRLPRLRRLVARPVPPNPPSDRRHPCRTLGWGEGRPRGAEEVHGPGRGRGSAAEPPQPAARPAAAPLSRAPGPTPQRRPRLLGHGPPCGLF